jgi:hypothetical protein
MPAHRPVQRVAIVGTGAIGLRDRHHGAVNVCGCAPALTLPPMFGRRSGPGRVQMPIWACTRPEATALASAA